MATTYENLAKHLKLAIIQLEELKRTQKVIDEDELCELMQQISDLVIDLPGIGTRVRHEGIGSRCGPKGDCEHDDVARPLHRG